MEILENYDQNESWDSYSVQLLKKYRKVSLPLKATFELTPLCNFKCNMCYIRLDKENISKYGNLLSTKEWISLGEQAAKMGVLFLQLTGGEAIVREDFREIYKSLYEMGFLITLRTNGFLMNEENIRWLSNRKPRTIQITLYGASDEMYEKVCGIKNGFSTVSKNIDMLLALGFNVGVSYTETTQNTEEAIKAFNWAKDRGLRMVAFRGLLNSINDGQKDISSLRIVPKEEDCKIDETMKFRSYERRIDDFIGAKYHCKEWGTVFCVSWNGKLSFCNVLTSIQETIQENKLDKSYGKLMQRLNSLKRPAECENCKFIDFCTACPAKLQSMSGNPEKISEDLCKIARYRYKKELLIK